MKQKKTKYDVGVLVGRFQVPRLHDGHRQLIQHVINDHEKVIIFLGLSPCRVTKNNPLDFESRKQMILEEFPDINVLYIRDVNNDELWSKDLDQQIQALVGPESSVVLYGSRESFLDHYVGKYDGIEMEQETFTSGTDIRCKIGKRVKASSEFREGVIWAAFNQYPRVIPTVDIAIWDGRHKRLLLARKPEETKYRFVGGFVQGERYEIAAKREVSEETHIEVGDLEYLGSVEIDDWRYRREVDKIVTLFFECTHLFGRPEPDDDICELRWFEFEALDESAVMTLHHPLLKILKEKYNK